MHEEQGTRDSGQSADKMGKLNTDDFPGSRAALVPPSMPEWARVAQHPEHPTAGGHHPTKQPPSLMWRVASQENLGNEGLKTLLQFGIIPSMFLLTSIHLAKQ